MQDRSAERLQRAVEVARLGSWELDLVRQSMWASDEAFRLYGLPVAPGHERSYEEIKEVPLAEERPKLDACLRALLQDGVPYDLQFRIRRRSDGAIRWIHSRAELDRDASGAPRFVIGTLQDLTDLVEASELLRAREERARMVVDQAADAIFLGDAKGVFTGVNERAAQLTGYAQTELVGKTFALLFSSEVLARTPLRYDLLERGETVVNERELLRMDGGRIVVEMRTRRLPDATYQAIVRDISERRRLEELLQVQHRMDSIGTLASGVAHDFNNILTAILGYADLLSHDAENLGAEQRGAVDSILRASHRAADLVRGLQSLARQERSPRSNVDLHRVAAEVFQVLGETTNRLIGKELQLPPDRFFVDGNESDLYHALMNLGINAIQAIEERGAREGDRIYLRAEHEEVPPGDPAGQRAGSYVHVIFGDTGPGMTPEVRRHAFEPLFTTKAKSERKGQGLGLTMVYNVVVRQHGGHATIDSAPGEGTRIHLHLPRAPEAVAQPPPQPAPSAAIRGVVLVVDDEPQILRLTRVALERSGLEVLTAADGREAVEVYARERARIDLVILDRSLPKLPGERVLRELRALDAGVRVIVSSGEAFPARMEFPGVQQFLAKPYTLATLRKAVEEALRGM